MRRVTLDGLDQVGDEVVALLELHVDVGKGLTDPLPQGDEAVVNRGNPKREHNDNPENNERADGHVERLLSSGAGPGCKCC